MSSVEHSVERVISQLTAAATSKQRARLQKGGIADKHILGVNKPEILKLARALGSDQTLAEALWHSSYHEARLTAILIADPASISNRTLISWANDLWSWGITDHFARYLVPRLDYRELLTYCFGSELLYVKRLGFAGIACLVQKKPELADDEIAFFLDSISQAAVDDRHHVRKAVVWALVEIGKSSDARRESAVLIAADLASDATGRPNGGWVGRNALKELEKLVSVKERRRLITRSSKTAQKNIKRG